MAKSSRIISALSPLLLAALLPSVAAAANAKCGAGNGKPATGEPIVIGGIVSATGPDNFSSSGLSASAYFKCVNANGGIHGRPIRYMMEDDAWNPEQAAQLAAKLVRDQKAVALVGNMSFVECTVNQALYEKEDIMVVAGVGVPRNCYFQRNFVTTITGPRISNTVAIMDLVRDHPGKIKRIVCLAPNIQNVGEWGCGGVIDWMKTQGGTGKIIPFDLGSVDATSLVLQAMAFKPDAVLVATPKGVAVPIFAAAEEQRLADKTHWTGPASLYSDDFPKAIGPYWEGKVTVGMEFNAADSGKPDTENWLAVMKQYAAPSDPRDTFSQAGYLAARVATETLLKLDPKKVDRKSVTAALRGVYEFSSDMLCSNWYIGDGPRHNPNHAAPVSIIKGGKWVQKTGCLDSPDPELADIKAYEKKKGLAK